MKKKYLDYVTSAKYAKLLSDRELRRRKNIMKPLALTSLERLRKLS